MGSELSIFGLKLSATRLALLACLLIPAVYTAVALVSPPSMDPDVGWGLMAWRSMLQGAPFNHYLTPDPANIGRDTTAFLAWWSPGQYLAPGAFSLTGLNYGQAIALTNGLALTIFLIGIVRLCRRFDLDPLVTLAAVLLLATFRYSTATFGIYNGGEILLQAALPWVVLLSLRVPAANLLTGAGLAFLIVGLGFMAKLTGIVVGAAALTASCLPVLLDRRRITPGMIGGVIGAGIAVVLLYVLWFSNGDTPGTIAVGAKPGGVALAVISPWTAGFSFVDLLLWLFIHPGRAVFSNVSTLVLMSAPVAALIAFCVLMGRKRETLRPLIVYALIFYAFTSLIMAVMFLRGADVTVEERHVRSAGILLFLCSLAGVMNLPRLPRTAFLGLFAVMSAYGLASMGLRTKSVLHADHLIARSGVNDMFVDRAAVEFIQGAYVREGKSALFVVPMADIALALPNEARVVSISATGAAHLEAARYDGAVPGHLYIMIQKRFVDTPKGRSIPASFAAYAPDRWEFQDFGDTRVYFQQAGARP